MTILGVAGVAIGICATVAHFARQGRTEESRAVLGAALVNATPQSWLSAINSAFLFSFDRLYGGRRQGRTSVVRRAMWSGLITSTFYILLTRVGQLGIGDTSPTGIILLLGIAVAFFMSFVYWLVEPIPSFARMRQNRQSRLTDAHWRPRPRLLAILELLERIGPGARFVARVSLPLWMAIIFWLIGAAAGQPLWRLVATSGAVAGFAFLIQVVPARLDRLDIPVSPFRAIGSAILVVALVSVLWHDATTAFLDELHMTEPSLLGFLAFNIYADSLSLVETRWILLQSQRATIPRLIGWLLLDIAFSASIFLLLPTILGELPSVIEGMLFSGDKPWFGILFWSTFSTSIVFYIFVLSAFVAYLGARLLRSLGRMGFDLQREPETAIASGAVLVILVVAAVASIATM